MDLQNQWCRSCQTTPFRQVCSGCNQMGITPVTTIGKTPEAGRSMDEIWFRLGMEFCRTGISSLTHWNACSRPRVKKPGYALLPEGIEARYPVGIVFE